MSLKIIDKLHRAESEGRCLWSFEYFPPKTAAGVENLFARMERMWSLAPAFIDVTWGAGGSTAELTLDICTVALSALGLNVCMHLTCTNMPRTELDKALAHCKEVGIRNILALRGDPPRGQDRWEATEGGLNYSIDLVKYIREKHGDWFCIAVAGYPEGHLDNPDKEDDLRRLKDKVDAGADFIVSQMFYDCDLFIDWVKRCRAIGINCPILPGIMPIHTYNGFIRMTSLSQTKVPDFIYKDLDPIKDDDELVKAYGVNLAAQMCTRLKEEGDILFFHFYTMNLEKSVRLILEKLEWVAPLEESRPLPWIPSLASKRQNEAIRPVYWKNRTRSYIARTAENDEFVNGRWSSSASPAFGDVDGYGGVFFKHSKEQARAVWGLPRTVADLANVFVGYCQGTVKFLPWSEQPLAGESMLIRDDLALLNKLGYLTINSQPPVNGVPSSHPVHGWGPKNGYCFQKMYIEFFLSPELFDALVAHLAEVDPDGVITYHAVQRKGENVRFNDPDPESANALTWGVFPGKEIVQPTVTDLAAFMAWYPEAFELFDSWANVYDKGSEERKLVEGVAGEWWLVNVVNNDFTAPKDKLIEVLKGAARRLEEQKVAAA
ncbi:methylenetetrahydrofolate reductase-domain-containing protein [Catenaria anguillulae PL171]|uniref:Methylenetetrahydrofolate reductase-domain-containing protein n=1 Tax=Catenaria anguillulae PL171 TaxID=765915 RepID=A0A1Y2I0I9_9FUNG|nr:methylenetetrahydrofolate reductase-domain-containing protein [Catenaria anguillulae PL171]